MKPKSLLQKIVLLTLVTLLAACATTPEERRANAVREANRLKQTHGLTCERLGYERDTEKWRDCLLEMEKQRLIQQQMMMDRMNYWSPGFYSPFYYGPRCYRYGARLMCR
ncbi:MAG: hypothetical protein LBE24_05375 [Methylobacillus sp.]|jgi:hypothetical protein|nr:hypothetical protein [Methylobacillus sp.]